MSKKVLFIHHGWGIGGAPISLLKLAVGLEEKGYQIKVLFLKQSDVVALFQEKGIEHQVLGGWFYTKLYKYWQHNETKRLKFTKPHVVIRVFLSWVLNAFYFAPRVLAREKPDILHLNSVVLSDWCVANKPKGTKLVVHVRETLSKGWFGIRSGFIKATMKSNANKILAISKDVATRINIPELVEVVYNPFVIWPRAKLPATKQKKVVYLGGASAIKGFNELMRALPNIDKEVEIELLGYYPNNFAAPQENVNVVGVVSQEEVAAHLSKACLLIVPTVKPHFARPVIESYAVGTAVLAFDIEGMDEIIQQNVTGFLVPPNADSLASGINQAVRDMPRLLEMGKAGHEFAGKQFSERTSVEKVHEVYSQF